MSFFPLESGLQHPKWEIPFRIPTTFFLLQNTPKWGWTWTRWISASPTRFRTIATKNTCSSLDYFLYKSGSNHHIYHHQLFIDGLFCDATSGKKLRSIDPRNEELICEVTLFQSLSFEHFFSFFANSLNHYHLSIFVIYGKFVILTFMI